MPGVNEAELKARRRRSAAQLTGRPFPVSVGSGAPGGPNRESAAVAEEKDKPKEEFEENIISENVVMADRADDSCCARLAHYCSGLLGREAAFSLSWSGQLKGSAQLK